MVRDEMLIELGDSWLTTKIILVKRIYRNESVQIKKKLEIDKLIIYFVRLLRRSSIFKREKALFIKRKFKSK